MNENIRGASHSFGIAKKFSMRGGCATVDENDVRCGFDTPKLPGYSTGALYLQGRTS